MNVIFKKAFLKDLQKLPLDIRTIVEKEVFETFPNLQNLLTQSQVKKIVGYENYYRIRVRSYRVGFELRSETVVFYRVLHRKEIYRYFP